MGILGRLLKRGETKSTKEADESSTECAHTRLHPHWDDLQEMGDDGKASSYRCGACGAAFSGDEGQRLIAEESKRVAEIERL